MTALSDVAALIREADSILFITGAGMSADSGLPTYRGVGGLYEAGNTEEGYAIEEILSGSMLARRPELTMKYLRQISDACFNARPNDGHRVIAEIEQAKSQTWTVTQNVDGFHRAAGNSQLVELHGNLEWLLCTQCSFTCESTSLRQSLDAGGLPVCPECAEMLRPDVVLFGEFLADSTLEQLKRLADIPFDLTFWIGTTANFPYITWFLQLAMERGLPTVEINPTETRISHAVDYRIETTAAESLRRLWDLAQKEDSNG